MDQSNPNYLQDIEEEINLEPVSAGVRFANFIIDIIVFSVLFYGIVIFWIIAMYREDNYFNPSTSNGWLGMVYLVYFALFLAYFGVIEFAAKGRTIAKFITGTVAVKNDGSPLSFKNALLRSLCRLIPFEVFSGFGGRPWHDTITNTMVIRRQR